MRTLSLKHFARWIIFLVLILPAFPAGTVEPAHIRSDRALPDEYELKAIYLYNFLQFVQWPQDKCPLPGGHAHEIGVVGDSSFNPVLQALQAKIRNRDKKLSLTFYGSYHEGMDFSNCSLLFITRSEQDNLPKILAAIAGRPILTVADSPDCIDAGVMITLLRRQNKIRWAINREPVELAGLRMNAKLLDIAVQVID